MLKQLVLSGFRRAGYIPVRVDVAAIEPTPTRDVPTDFTRMEEETYKAVAPFTMTTPERVQSLVAATQHLVTAHVTGAIVECGVWKGGSMMAIARTLLELGVTDRDLYLFDTFEGMTEPTDDDTLVATGGSAASVLATEPRDSRVWAYAGLDEVKANVARVGYDPERIHFVKGPVEETLPARAPGEIALLRLDTDWYQSTKHELVHLYPRLVVGGVLILDDYGSWVGARKAVDEYLAEEGIDLLLHRIDTTGRIALKVGV